MERRTVCIRIEFSKRQMTALLAFVMIAAQARELASETLTLTTTYPAPSGVYAQIITTGGAGLDTTLNRGSGNVVLVPATNANGKVGIGVSSPAAKLDVSGTVKVVIDGTQAAGMVLTTDDKGNASWGYATYAP